ncbi:hypothetical protein EVAR_44228_1 [Eumeta japonica]|uniref:Uncharacterized protein n=1 Tax=Eumeta variegata TaxID=151549 RepID=A0A4C1W1J1_EUMVA|nr:hypothetical protein EVAR_44228_1 [Eumeta japonica]
MRPGDKIVPTIPSISFLAHYSCVDQFSTSQGKFNKFCFPLIEKKFKEWAVEPHYWNAVVDALNTGFCTGGGVMLLVAPKTEKEDLRNNSVKREEQARTRGLATLFPRIESDELRTAEKLTIMPTLVHNGTEHTFACGSNCVDLQRFLSSFTSVDEVINHDSGLGPAHNPISKDLYYYAKNTRNAANIFDM